jgi:hypothetical protein
MTPTLGFSFGGLFFKTKGFAQSDLYLKNTFKNKNLKMFFFKTLIVPAESSLLPVAKTAPRQKLLAELTRDHNTQVKKLQKLTRPAHRPPRSPWRRSTLCHHPLEDARETRGRPRVIPP